MPIYWGEAAENHIDGCGRYDFSEGISYAAAKEMFEKIDPGIEQDKRITVVRIQRP